MNLAAALRLSVLTGPMAAVTAREDGLLRSFVAAMTKGRATDSQATRPDTGYYKTAQECDYWTEEPCYNETTWEVTSCALIADGGCPCPEGEAKCCADEFYSGYCTTLCCDHWTEETCYNETTWDATSCAPIADGGCPCPEGEAKCGGDEFWPGYCTAVCCDWETEETCYDETTWEATSCAPIADGGCPCPEGEDKCGADASLGFPGYCQTVCCDFLTEQTCYDETTWEPFACAPYEEGCPCPEGQDRCGGYEGYAGYCSAVCCDWETEETCYDETTWEATSCASFAEGCPCPEGEEKCGGDEFYAGICQTIGVCCDHFTEETCYDETTWDATSCALIADGGCPCPQGQEKCGANEFYAGYCQPIGSVCCDWETEETCYDETTWEKLSCAPFGGCPFNESDLVQRYGMPNEVDYHKGLVMKLKSIKNAAGGPAKHAIEHKINEVVDSIIKRQQAKAAAKRDNFEVQKSQMAKFIKARGTEQEVAYFRYLKLQQKTLSDAKGEHVKNAKFSLEQKELKLVRSIQARSNAQGNLAFENAGAVPMM